MYALITFWLTASLITLLRVPDGGIQPQVALDAKGTVHMIYFQGLPAQGDIYYVRSTDDGTNFSDPMRVNSQAESAIATGNVRGAHLAVGKNGRVHVAWMGSKPALPRVDGRYGPMLYARLNDAGTAFEEQRNVIQNHPGLDGGGSIAADGKGNVYIAWHAPGEGEHNEANRRIWVTHSTDDGKTFSPELAAWEEPTGACACCGMRVFADNKGTVYVLYRSAKEAVHRDMYLLSATDGKHFEGTKVHEWNIDHCVMSTAAFSQSDQRVLAAWETEQQVYFTTFDPVQRRLSKIISAPDEANGRKHPVIAANKRGETLLVWTEGMGWKKGGAVAWQLFDQSGQPIPAEGGRRDGVPVWSLVAAFARPDGGFVIVY